MEVVGKRSFLILLVMTVLPEWKLRQLRSEATRYAFHADHGIGEATSLREYIIGRFMMMCTVQRSTKAVWTLNRRTVIGTKGWWRVEGT